MRSSFGFPIAASMAKFTMLRVRRSSPGRSHTSPQQYRSASSWNGRSNAVAPASAAADRASPITSPRTTLPRSNRSSFIPPSSPENRPSA